MTSADRRQGIVIWITGLPGAGKTTISRDVYRQLAERTPAVVRIDGDQFRELMGNDVGYSPADRLVNARRISRLCQLLSSQGVHVVCATVSLFHECHEWNRTHLPRYVEVFLRVRNDTLLARDQKGLFSAAAGGAKGEVVGAGQTFDAPLAPDAVIDTDDDGTPAAVAAQRIVSLVEQKHGSVD